MYYIVNNNNRVVFRSKNKATVEATLVRMRKHSEQALHCSITDTKPKVDRPYKYVSVLSY